MTTVTCQSGRMPVTPKRLFEELLKVEDATTDEDLVYKLRGHGLKIGLRTFQRWKDQEDDSTGPHWAYAIALLEHVGWLSPEALARPAPAAATEAEADQALGRVETEGPSQDVTDGPPSS